MSESEATRKLELERNELEKRLEFAEMLLDGGKVTVHGMPWREAWERMQALADSSTPYRSASESTVFTDQEVGVPLIPDPVSRP